jgi:3-oxoacyl-[acyl-carrier protein] reductase
VVKPLVPSFTGSEIEGGVAVVTGAGVGLGRAEALALAAAGAKVVVNDIGDAADAVAAEIVAAGGAAVGVPGDIGDWDFATSLVSRAVEEYGDLNILVNNAGVLRDRMIFSVSAEEWDTVIRVHLRGHAATCQAATAYWRERSKASGEPQWARVINTASEAFLFGSPGQPNYSAAKAGIAALTLSVAHGSGRYGVRANAIAPRARTAMTEATFPPAPDGDEIDPCIWRQGWRDEGAVAGPGVRGSRRDVDRRRIGEDGRRLPRRRRAPRLRRRQRPQALSTRGPPSREGSVSR